AQIQGEARGAFGVIDGNQRLTRLRGHVEAPKTVLHDVRRRSGGTAGKGGTSVKPGVAKDVLAGGDIERRAGTRNKERAETESLRKIERAAHENPIAEVERSTTVVQGGVQGIRRDIAGPRGVAIGIVEDVVAKQRNRAHAHVGIHDELVLLENALGLVLIEDFAGRRQARRIGVDKIRIKLVVAAGVEIGDGNVGDLGELALEGHTCLYYVRSAQVGIEHEFSFGSGGRTLEARGQYGLIGIEEKRVGHQELLLIEAVL